MAQGKNQSTLVDKLDATGAKLVELASKVKDATKSVAVRTNNAVKKAVDDTKVILEEKRENKARKAQDDLSSEGLIEDIPPMVTLPEFENERMIIVTEQQENQISMLDHMQRISERVDVLERRHKARLEELFPPPEIDENDDSDELSESPSILGASAAMVEVLHILGASIMWIAILIGIARYGESKDIVIASVYPIGLFIWSIGSTTWVLYLLYRLAKSGIGIPMLIRVQTALAVGLVTLMGVLMNDNSMTTVSSIWTWGTLVTIGLLVGSSMIATAWRTTKKLVSPGNNNYSSRE